MYDGMLAGRGSALSTLTPGLRRLFGRELERACPGLASIELTLGPYQPTEVRRLVNTQAAVDMKGKSLEASHGMPIAALGLSGKSTALSNKSIALSKTPAAGFKSHLYVHRGATWRRRTQERSSSGQKPLLRPLHPLQKAADLDLQGKVT